MKTHFRNSLKTHFRNSLLVACVALMTSACVQNTPTAIQMIGNGVVLRPPGGGGGAFPGTCIIDQVLMYRSFGTLDLMVVPQYDFFPELRNRLQPTGTVSGNLLQHLRSDASFITIQGAEVTARILRSSDGPYSSNADLPASAGWNNANQSPDGSFYYTNTWYSPFTIGVEAQGKALARFELIPHDVGIELRRAWFKEPGSPDNYADRYTAKVPIMLDIIVEGRMADGTMVRTQAVPYRIDMCWGCLINLPVPVPDITNVSQAYIYGQCSSKLTGTEYTPPCLPGNDEFIPCTFYCHMCHGNESLTTSAAQELACDTRFCPKDPE